MRIQFSHEMSSVNRILIFAALVRISMSEERYIIVYYLDARALHAFKRKDNNGCLN